MLSWRLDISLRGQAVSEAIRVLDQTEEPPRLRLLATRMQSTGQRERQDAAQPHPRRLSWIGTTALAMGGSNQCLFLITALFVGQEGIPGQGSAAVPLLLLGLLLSYAAAPGWTELVLMSPNRVGGISAACTEAFRPYSAVLSTLAGACYWWGWIPTCGITAILSATAINHWCLPEVPVSLIACMIVIAFTAINLAGVRWVAWLAVPVAVASATLAFISMMAPLLTGSVDWGQAATFRLDVPFPGWFGEMTSFMAGLYLIGFGAPAFEAAACHVGETRDPARNVPRAMVASGAMAAVYFVALPIVWLGSLGPNALGQDLQAALGPTFAPVFGGAAKSAAIGFMMFNMFHGTLQPLAGAARALSQLSDDGLAPRFLGWRLSTDSPWAATLLTAGTAILFLLIGDPIWLIAAANFTYLIGICLPSVAVWLLRRDQPDAPRLYRAPRGTILLGLVAALTWGCSALLGFEQFGLKTVVFGLLMAYSGAAFYGWRMFEDRRARGLPGFRTSLHLKLTGAMLLVLALDAAGYMLAVGAIPEASGSFLTALEDIFVAVAFLTISVGIVLPGMIARSADTVSEAAQRLAVGTVRDFAKAMDALGEGRLEAAHAAVDIVPVVVRSRDELGQMAESFNMLQEGVRKAALGLDRARNGLGQARLRLLDANSALAGLLERQRRLGQELVSAKEAAFYDASHDLLTKLPNRKLFSDRLERAIAALREGGSPFCVLFIDLDGFKVVNDSLGHLAGNQLISAVADRLRDGLPRRKTTPDGLDPRSGRSVLARLGGDEFAVLVPAIDSREAGISVAQGLQEQLSAPFQIDGQDVFATASIGVALSSDGHHTPEDILREADLAMYRAKRLGKARAELYDTSMHEGATKRLALETDLRLAVRNGEFVLHYQPIVSLDTSYIAGFEALVRWHSPERGLVYPDAFITVAEETGLIVPIGLSVLQQVCEQVKLWRELPLRRSTRVSVNISPRQFAHADIVESIERVLTESGVDAGLIKLEITESGTMGDAERAVRVLGQLKTLGVELCIDDFGTGYSSLSYLQRFPVDVLKIDRSFVDGMLENEESRAIVGTILTLARSRSMRVVAEGIETAEQAAELLKLGCQYGQGYYFSKPVPAAVATAMLTEQPNGARLAVAAA